MNKKHYIIPIFVPHVGCPHDCVFCNQKKITGGLEQTFADMISPTAVNEIILQYLKTISKAPDTVVEVAFYGGSFTGIPIHIQEPLLAVAFSYMNSGQIQGIRLSTRPDYIDDDILMHLKKYGVNTIELGVQSLDEEVLKQSNRGHTVQDVIQASKRIKQHGITLGLQMMIGLPGDTEQKIYHTAKKMIALKPKMVRIYPTVVIKGTALEKKYYDKTYEPLTLESAVSICKNLLVLFDQNDIQVIRIGLQPTENIAHGKDVIAGPLHPAMRMLVESDLRLDMIKQLLKRICAKIVELNIYVNPKSISETIGLKKKNIVYLEDTYGIQKVKVLTDSSIKRDAICIIHHNQRHCIDKNMIRQQKA